MTDQEETLLENTDESDEVHEEEEEQESIVDELELTDNEDDEDIDLEMLEDEDGYMMDMGMGNLLSSILATEDGDTVCSALVNISRNIEVQNKILIKMLAQMQKISLEK